MKFFYSHMLSMHGRWAVTLLVTLSLSIRLWAFYAWDNSLYGDFLVWDERVYHRWAIALTEGNGFSPVYDFTPLYAYLMTFIYKIFGINIFYVRIMNIVFGVFVCLLVFLIAREIANRTAGYFACLAACFYKPFIFFSITLMKTSLSLFLFALTVYLFLLLMKKPSFPRMFFMGISAGLLLNVRANCLFMIPVLPFAAVVWQGKARHKIFKSLKTNMPLFAVYFAALFISLLPFAVQKYRMTGDISLTAAGGFNFYLGNHSKNPLPYYRPVPFASSSASRQATQFMIEAGRKTGRELSLKEASDYWVEETLRQIGESPMSFLKKTGRKLLALFHRFESADNYHIGFISRFVPFFRLPFLEFWMLFPLGIMGFSLTVKGSRKIQMIGTLILCYAVTLIIIFSNIRIRLPLMAVMIPLAIIGINQIASHFREKQFQKAGFGAFTAAVFFIIAFLPLKGTDDLTAHYNTHAVLLQSKGLKAEALEFWKTSSEMKLSYSVFADLSLANLFFNRRDVQKAFEYLDRIPDGSFAAAYKYGKMGDFYMRRSDSDKAIRAYEKSLEINSGQTRVIRKLIRIYKGNDDEKSERLEDCLNRVLRYYGK